MGANEPASILATRVRYHRQKKRLSVTALAAKARMPREELSRIENGHSRNPSLDRLHALASALGVRVTSLLA